MSGDLPCTRPPLRSYSAQRFSDTVIVLEFPTGWALISFSEHSLSPGLSHPGSPICMDRAGGEGPNGKRASGPMTARLRPNLQARPDFQAQLTSRNL